MVVIMVNFQIFIRTHNHTLLSISVILLSIGSFYLAVFTMSQFKMFNILVGLFNQAMYQPQFYFIVVFFCLGSIGTDTLLTYTNEHLTL